MIEYIVIDVDGTLTDGGIYYDNEGNELKKYNTKDGAGFLVAATAGVKTVIITGREFSGTAKRMKELKAAYIFQDVHDKRIFLEKFMKEHNISSDRIGYIGDDINDLSAMELVGFVGCPADSCIEVRGNADYVSRICGGYGAVRDIIEYILRSENRWEENMKLTYGCGR